MKELHERYRALTERPTTGALGRRRVRGGDVGAVGALTALALWRLNAEWSPGRAVTPDVDAPMHGCLAVADEVRHG